MLLQKNYLTAERLMTSWNCMYIKFTIKVCHELGVGLLVNMTLDFVCMTEPAKSDIVHECL